LLAQLNKTLHCSVWQNGQNTLVWLTPYQTLKSDWWMLPGRTTHYTELTQLQVWCTELARVQLNFAATLSDEGSAETAEFHSLGVTAADSDQSARHK